MSRVETAPVGPFGRAEQPADGGGVTSVRLPAVHAEYNGGSDQHGPGKRVNHRTEAVQTTQRFCHVDAIANVAISLQQVVRF